MNWQKCNVVMLPTKDELAPILAHNRTKRPQYFTNKYWSNKDLTKQHLYITNPKEEIEEDDWMYDSKLNIVIQYKSYKDGCEKIIATTDESLGLPRPSDEFIKQYCELNDIDKVLVEYDEELIITQNGINKIFTNPRFNNILY